MRPEFLIKYFDRIIDHPLDEDVTNNLIDQYLIGLNTERLDILINQFDKVLACYYMTHINDILKYAKSLNIKKSNVEPDYQQYVLRNVSEFEQAYQSKQGKLGLQTLGLNLLFLTKSNDTFGLFWYSQDKYESEFGKFKTDVTSESLIYDIESSLEKLKDDSWVNDYGKIDSRIFKYNIFF